jgi:hypothetical protein
MRGPWSTRFVDLSGMRFGSLVVGRRAPDHITSGGLSRTCWHVRCDCGVEKVVRAGSLRSGNTTSCGCNQGKPQSPGVALRNYVLRAYKASAKHRKVEWYLTDEQFDSLTKQACHYCGVAPFAILTKRGHLGSFTYNGIDRVDNSKGYLSENVVPCCKPCNYAKGRMSYQDFLAWLDRIRSSKAVSRGTAQCR